MGHLSGSLNSYSSASMSLPHVLVFFLLTERFITHILNYLGFASCIIILFISALKNYYYIASQILGVNYHEYKIIIILQIRCNKSAVFSAFHFYPQTCESVITPSNFAIASYFDHWETETRSQYYKEKRKT